MKTRSFISMSIMVALFLGISVSANAGLIFNISDDNISGVYGNVEFANDGDGVKFTITSESSLFDKFYFNLDNPISITNDLSIISDGKWKVLTNENASSFGEFDYLIQGIGFKDPLQFRIDGISLPPDNETLFVAEPNHGEALFAGHLQGDNSYVGRIANPIPGAIWLLGSGLVGLVVVRRRASK